MTVFLRLLQSSVDAKARDLRQALAWLCQEDMDGPPPDGTVFVREPSVFTAIPGSPLAYWTSDNMLALFKKLPRFESGNRVARRTNATTDDGRWIRAWWEVPPAVPRWVPHAKGGAYSPYWADLHLVVGWDNSKRTYPGYLGTAHRPDVRPASLQYFFRPGLTWPRRTDGLSFRVLPANSIFGDKGPVALVSNDSPSDLLALCAILNSGVFKYLVSTQLARTELAQSFEAGLIQQTPIPDLLAPDNERLATLARRAWSLKRTLDTTNEVSHAFLIPAGLIEKVSGFNRGAIERELDSTQKQIDEAAVSLYGLRLEDRATIEASSKCACSSGQTEEKEPDDEGDDASEDEAPIGTMVEALNSWLVGIAFGRFDPRFATGERPIPPEPEPFDPLPSRSPGMWPEGAEPADRPDILVDDNGHASDLLTRVRAVAERVHTEVPEDLRAWFAKQFFPLHIKMYSKSRRKAPIYWQLATLSASYSIWLYIHAFSKDTLFRVQNDYAAPKLAHEERRLELLIRELREKATPAQRKELAAQEAFVEELRAFLEEVKRVAPLWNPNLDDGVLINFAPLWRLVPHFKPWQKELKATWDALCEGKCDWAHLAMHLWPERVVPKCATDRSLAISHGLEDAFWVAETDGKWAQRNAPTRSVEELVRERTSTAVKSALGSLLEAPTATGSGSRGRGGRRRSASSSGEGGT